MFRHATLLSAGWLVLLAASWTWAGDSPPEFEADVAPILAAHCQKCHGDAKPKAGFSVTSATALARGGESGPAIVPGQAEKSLLVEMLSEGTMPPDGEGQLTALEIDLVRRWIAAGARGQQPIDTSAVDAPIDPAARDFWAFRRLSSPAVPATPGGSPAMPVDAFLSARLTDSGLTFSPPADRFTLLRRASYDLIGLPPTPDEIAAFIADDRPDAYERVVDRLLASPHFGERWGRHWLDAAGYSDITGGDNDAGIIKLSDSKWKYRDYVVRAFNDDKPYDRFLVEQLAGDELVDWRNAQSFTPEIAELLIATGFLRGAADDTDEKELTTPDILNGILQRTSEVAVNSLLGLTLACAKCHDHKYEPIPQRDYYRLLAIFSPTFNPAAWVPPKLRTLADIAPAEKAEAERHNAQLDAQLEVLRKQQTELRAAPKERLQQARLAALPEQIRDDAKTAIATPAAKRSEVQKYLAEKFAASLQVSDSDADAALDDAGKSKLAAAELAIASLSRTRRSWGAIQAAYDVGPPSETHVLRRGNHETPGAAIEPGFLCVLCPPNSRAGLAPDASAPRPVGPTSGRRLALAHWITDWDSPAGALTARVMVNRVWQHLFGRGIVETTENLGFSGARPTHAELLEWLTCHFTDGGSRIKPLIKLLVTSTAYRQASASTQRDGAAGTDLARARDPANQLLWHMPLKRLEAEIIRDAILSTGGALDPALGGPPLPLETRSDGSVVIQDKNLPHPAAKLRRSVYVLARRNYHLTMLGVFDEPAMSTNCPRRQQSAVVLQSLAMLNDAFVVDGARRFAARVGISTAESAPARPVELAFQIALGRNPSAAEASWSSQLLAEHQAQSIADSVPNDQAAQRALEHLCHMLLGSNEFLYTP